MDTETLFTVQEAAAKIGVSPSAIRNATLDGRLAFVTKFRRKLIEQEALTEYQKRTQNGGVSTPGRPRGAKNRRMLQAQEENEQAQEENGVEASPATLGVDSPTEKA